MIAGGLSQWGGGALAFRPCLEITGSIAGNRSLTVAARVASLTLRDFASEPRPLGSGLARGDRVLRQKLVNGWWADTCGIRNSCRRGAEAGGSILNCRDEASGNTGRCRGSYEQRPSFPHSVFCRVRGAGRFRRRQRLSVVRTGRQAAAGTAGPDPRTERDHSQARATETASRSLPEDSEAHRPPGAG